VFKNEIKESAVGDPGDAISHFDLEDIGTYTHAQIDTHIDSATNPHSVSWDDALTVDEEATQNPVLSPGVYLQGEYDPGPQTRYNLIGFDSGINKTYVGNSSLNTWIKASSGVYIDAASLAIDANDKYLYGRDTGAAARKLAGVDSNDAARFGDDNVETHIYGSAWVLQTNNMSLRSVDNAGTGTIDLIKGNAVDGVVMGANGNGGNIYRSGAGHTFYGGNFVIDGGSVYMDNAEYIRSEISAGGSYVRMLGLNSSNQIVLGENTAYRVAVYSKDPVWFMSSGFRLPNDKSIAWLSSLSSTISLIKFSASDALELGDTGYEIDFYGSATRPQYNGNDLALFSDVGEGDCPEYKYIKATGQSEGDLHLSDGTNWNTSNALIKRIKVETSSSDWDAWILQNDNGYATDDANIPAIKIMEAGNGDYVISLDHPYEDEDASAEVHLYFVDNAGTDTFDIYVLGYGLTTA
jgi:hypothetical protein